MRYNIRLLSFRNKVLYIALGSILCAAALLLSDKLAGDLQKKEVHLINLWSMAASKTSAAPLRDYKADLKEMLEVILQGSDDIPRIVTDQNLNVEGSKNIDEDILSNPRRLSKKMKSMANKNTPIEINFYNGMYISQKYIFYGNSPTINLLRIFPLISIIIALTFISFSYLTYSSTKRDEQNKVWIGMAKETAHQLGTPTSSLLGWIEYLREQNVEEMAINEMSKDIDRLLIVVDRFSKIGSNTALKPLDISEVAYNTVSYFRMRLPKKTSIDIHIKDNQSTMIANANEVLYGWVLENLIRNAVDALSGKGKIDVVAFSDKKWIYVDVQDNGKGIAAANVDKIFKPGFTTKSRGWGLGLSLCSRIIKEYHKGKIFVAHSEIDKGTTIRVMVKRINEDNKRLKG